MVWNVDYNQWKAQEMSKMKKEDTTMDTKTTEALEGSIKKWEKIVQGNEEDDGIANCPLCTLFHAGACKKCPVQLTTKAFGCGASPHEKWMKHQEEVHWLLPKRRAACRECQDLAQQEVDFLKSLREPEESKIEPQAGDVWRLIECPIFIKKSRRYGLGYVFDDGMEGVMSAREKIAKYPEATRIFSLSEYLKNKKEGK